jgi:Astacin (Peptidase family M12A)
MSCETIVPEAFVVTPFRGPNGMMSLFRGAVHDGKVFIQGDIYVGTIEEVAFARAFFALQTSATLEGVSEEVLESALRFFPTLYPVKAAFHNRMRSKSNQTFSKELDLIEAYLRGDRSDQVKPFGGVIVGSNYRWNSAQVPYVIDGSILDQTVVTQAIAYWAARTKIQFIDWHPPIKDWVVFQGGTGCSSRIGRQGGEQPIIVGSNCTAGNVIHEIGHAIGLYHEQARNDRDSYVDVQWSNIKQEYQDNYQKYGSVGSDVGEYDYGSIMHYPKFAPDQAIDPNVAVLIPKGPGPEPPIGQRNGLSDDDIATVASIYP